MKVKKSHDYCVLELSADRPGYIETQLRYVKPNIGVVTCVGIDQYKAFRTRENVAREKGKLIQSLPTDGFAILNADDPLVMGMAEGYSGAIVTYGTTDKATVRAYQIRSNWPERLCFTLEYNDLHYPVVTKVCGIQFLPSVLAAIATGVVAGIGLEQTIAAVESVGPFDGRMSPVVLDSGITFIRDDWKAPLWSFSAPLEFMKNASAQRKIVVVGTVSDYPGAASRTYRRVGEWVSGVADVGVFVGPHSMRALRFSNDSSEQTLFAFDTVFAVHEFFTKFLRPGDLVLLKGSNVADHLGRLALAHTMDVHCWLSDCGKSAFCNQCSLVSAPASGKSVALRGEITAVTPSAVSDSNPGGLTMMFIGLGNPGEQLQQTPHNIGQMMLDRFADSLGKSWVQDQDSMLIKFAYKKREIILFKPIAFVNETGPIIKAFLQNHDLKAEQCVLVYDDFDLPLGKVRFRRRGSDGGHRGVRSVLTALQTDNIPRLKIGMKNPVWSGKLSNLAVKQFTNDELDEVNAVCDIAIERAKELLQAEKSRTPPQSSRV